MATLTGISKNLNKLNTPRRQEEKKPDVFTEQAAASARVAEARGLQPMRGQTKAVAEKMRGANMGVATPQTVDQKKALGTYVPEITLTDAERAKAKVGLEVSERADRLNAVGEEYDLDIKPVSSLQEAVDRLKQQQSEELKQAQEQAMLAGRAENIARARQLTQAEAAKAATTASLAPGREGVMSATAPTAISEFNATIQGRVDEAGAQLTAARIRRENALKALEKAQQAGQEKMAESISQQLVKAEEDIAAAEQAQIEAQAAATKTGLDVVTSLADILGPAGIAKLSSEEVGDLFENNSLPRSLGIALQASSQALAEAEKTGDELKIQKAQADLQKVQAEAAVAGQTADIKNFKFMQSLPVDQREMFAEQLRANPNLQTIKIDDKAYLIDPKTGYVKNVIGEQVGQLSEYVTNTNSSRIIDIAKVSTGSPLPLNSLGNSTEIMRTDRHNNPIANKAYPTVISALENAGLKKGIDFAVGETTVGIDSDGVATIMYKDPQTGVLGSIAMLEKGQIGSWYANDKYGGSNKIKNSLSILSGKEVTASNAQEIFNSLSMDDKTQIVAEIYKHEGGNQLFKKKDSITSFPGLSDIIANSKRFVSAVASKKDVEETIKNYAKEGQIEEMQQYVKGLAFDDVNAEFKKNLLLRANLADVGEDLIAKVESYKDKGGDLGIFAGGKQDILNKLGKLDDPEMQAIGQDIRMMVEDFARAQTGAAIQDFERVEFGKIIGSIYDGDELLTSKIRSTADYWQRNADNTLKNKIGSTAYNSLFPEKKVEPTIEDYKAQYQESANQITPEENDEAKSFWESN